MIVNTNEVIYDDGRESSIIHFSNNHIHATIHKAHRRRKTVLIIFSWCSSKKKGRHQMEVCQMSISGAFDHSRTSKKTEERKKKERFSRKTSHFFEERARASEYTYTQK